MLINARRSLGLTTRLVNSKLGDLHFCQRIQLTGWESWQELSLRVCSRLGIEIGPDQIMHFGIGQQDMPVGYWIDFNQSKEQLHMNLSMARAIKDL